jgi:hypothetical protein
MSIKLFEKPVRAGIFVAIRISNFQAPLRSGITAAVRKDAAAPTGLDFVWIFDSINMPRLRR